MNKMIEIKRMGKKEKKEYNASNRSTWNLCPITRRKESKKIYHRNKVNKITIDY